jgi:hypothetical protein
MHDEAPIADTSSHKLAGIVTTALIDPSRLLSGAPTISGAVSKGLRVTRLSSRLKAVAGAKSSAAGAADAEVPTRSNSAVVQILFVISSLLTVVILLLISAAKN